MQNRIDHKKLEELRSAPIPSPIHAVNYVALRNLRYYRLYGLLLVPYAIPKGARPVWVGVHEDNLVGEAHDDEIVILEYPNHRVLLDIFTSPYYEAINGLRERGVRTLGFAICQQHGGVKKIGKGTHCVVRFNHRCDDAQEIRQLFGDIAETYGTIEYLAHETGTLDIFNDHEATDPVAVHFKHLGILSHEMTDAGRRSAFEATMRARGFEMTMQRFRTLGITESMPWATPHKVL